MQTRPLVRGGGRGSDHGGGAGPLARHAASTCTAQRSSKRMEKRCSDLGRAVAKHAASTCKAQRGLKSRVEKGAHRGPGRTSGALSCPPGGKAVVVKISTRPGPCFCPPRSSNGSRRPSGSHPHQDAIDAALVPNRPGGQRGPAERALPQLRRAAGADPHVAARLHLHEVAGLVADDAHGVLVVLPVLGRLRLATRWALLEGRGRSQLPRGVMGQRAQRAAWRFLAAACAP